MGGKIFNGVMSYSKRELARRLVKCTGQLSTWTETCLKICAYYYNLEPHAVIFNDNTFTEGTLQIIKDRAKSLLRHVPYSDVIYVVNELNGRDVNVHVVNSTNPEEVRKVIVELNKRILSNVNHHDDEVSDCKSCVFRESCAESTTVTGILVYNCKQYNRTCLEPHPDEGE